jgi:hypothetical protein
LHLRRFVVARFARDAAQFIVPASREKKQKLMVVMAVCDAKRRFQGCSACPAAGTADRIENSSQPEGDHEI